MAEEKKEQELSYDELKNAAIQLKMQNDKMREVIEKLSGVASAQQRLEFLFKVLNVAHMFNSEFVDKCAAEVEALMTLPEEEAAEEETETTEA